MATNIGNKIDMSLMKGKLRKDIETGDELTEQLVAVASTFKAVQGKLLFCKEKVETTRDKNPITDEGIIRLKAGLKRLREDGKTVEYATPMKADPARYGYMWAFDHEWQGMKVTNSKAIISGQRVVSYEETRTEVFLPGCILDAANTLSAIKYIDPTKKKEQGNPVREKGYAQRHQEVAQHGRQLGEQGRQQEETRKELAEARKELAEARKESAEARKESAETQKQVAKLTQMVMQDRVPDRNSQGSNRMTQPSSLSQRDRVAGANNNQSTLAPRSNRGAPPPRVRPEVPNARPLPQPPGAGNSGHAAGRRLPVLPAQRLTAAKGQGETFAQKLATAERRGNSKMPAPSCSSLG